MSVGLFQLLFVALLILVLFGRGRISEVMGDFGKGIKSFRRGISQNEPPLPAPAIDPAVEPVEESTR